MDNYWSGQYPKLSKILDDFVQGKIIENRKEAILTYTLQLNIQYFSNSLSNKKLLDALFENYLEEIDSGEFFDIISTDVVFSSIKTSIVNDIDLSRHIIKEILYKRFISMLNQLLEESIDRYDRENAIPDNINVSSLSKSP